MARKVQYLEEQLEGTRRREDLHVPVYDFDFDVEPHGFSVTGTSVSSPLRSASSYEKGNQDLVSAAEAADMFHHHHLSRNGVHKEGVAMRKSGGAQFISKTTGLSPQLQADTDRYLQKIKYIQDKKKLEILEQEKYELELEKRRLRASKTGGEFKSMREREERAREIKRIRDERKINKELEREAASIEETNKTITINANLRNSLKNSKNWDDIQKEEEIKRRDRIEKRKQQLSNLAAYPSTSIIESVDKWKTKDLKCDIPVHDFVPKANTPSPADICAQLKRRQEKWERHLQKEKELLNSKRKNTLPVKAAIDMQNRQKIYDENRKQKQIDRERKEQEDKLRQAAMNKKKTERIMRSKVPESSRRLTKASEDRAKSVRDSFERIRRKDEEDKKREMLNLRRSKEISSFLNTLVGAKDSANTEAGRLERARQKAQESANAYKQNRKRNQDRIKASLSQRPSLIERHDMAIASTQAATTALSKVAGIIRPQATYENGRASKKGDDDSWRNDFGSEELFDDDEKIQLGIRDN